MPGFFTVDSESEAIHLWNSNVFENARAVAWETMRYKISQAGEESVNQWKQEFDIFSKLLHDTLVKNSQVGNFLLRNNIELNMLLNGLPFVGAIGEIIAFNEGQAHNFFRSQMTVYQSGHWVCGWTGDTSESEYIYPVGNFFIY